MSGENANVVKIGGDFNMTTNSASKVIPISSVVPIIKMKSQTALSATTMTSSITPTFIPELVTAETGTYFRQFGNATQQTQVDFKRLASLLQQMIDKRKAKKSYITKEEEMKQNVKLKNDSLAGETIRSSFQQNTFSVSDLKPIEIRYHHLNPDSKPENSYAISKNLEIKNAKKISENGNSIGENEALKRSSRYPNEILASIFITKHKKVNDDMALSKIALPTSEMHTNENPMIYIIRQGSIVQNNRNGYEFVSTITLVVDNGEKILIDTGLSTDINERTWILQRLSELGAPPPSINHVITTHGHPDHSGNTNHFPDAFHYAGRFVHLGTHSYFSRIFETDVEKLTENVYLLKTPGHTSDDISVLINNTSFFGTVIVSGDIFIQKEDMKDSRIWKQLATNEIQQEESRRRLLCLADCIIPGHGSLFRVKSSMKRMLNCPDSY
uniref:Metallo-beta-lactamase domain-containing protein 1 n=1 Tax=Brugia malayi TaxID=6279 RepID=A0A5S6PMK7_BRUMA